METGGLCDSEDFYDDSFAALAVEFGVEDALPGAQVESAIGDREGGFVVEEQGFQVGVGIVFAGLVVLVAGVASQRTTRVSRLAG